MGGTTSNSHGHDDVAVLTGNAIARGTQLARALLIFQFDRDLVLRNGLEEIEQILCIEADLDIGTGVLAGYALFAFASLDTGGEDANVNVPASFNFAESDAGIAQPSVRPL